MSETSRSPHTPRARSAAPAGAQVIPLRPGDAAEPRRKGARGGGGDGSRPRVRVKKLRVLLLLAGLGLLAFVSTAFGMMMAVASDLPELEDPPTRNSELLDVRGRRLGLLTGSERRLFIRSEDIAPFMKHAIIAIEDKRFYTNDGVDLRGIGRALWQDIVQQRIVQGGSTITQQFVKNATAAQGKRTLFNKAREAVLAYHLTREWSKDRILRNYLNTIYFGNGAYGIEAAARVYFSSAHPGCGGRGNRCASKLEPHEAALIAGIVASPSAYDPIRHPEASRRRRDVVLRNMVDQRYLSLGQFEEARSEPVPTRYDIRPPSEETREPYFTAWVKQQVVESLGGGQVGAQQAYEGGLRVKTTLDLDLQRAARAAVDRWLPNPGGPRAAMAVIHNQTGEVRAMVGGDDHETSPFNLATQGQRQPGSAFKPFVLAEALRQGISPGSQWSSRKKNFCVTKRKGKCTEGFEVNNYEDSYAGVTSLAAATTQSDNAVYAEVAIRVGTGKVSRMARRMGIRTPVSRNLAISLGALKRGVTPLDMARAYTTIANRGRLVYGSLSPGARRRRTLPVPGPVAIREMRRGDELIELPNGDKARNRKRTRRVLEAGAADAMTGMLASVVKSGTGRRADLGDDFAAGKTGTTENYGDAWFVGFTKAYTVAVWVGYPDKLQFMKTEFGGEPVAGGTYPALIWKAFMEQALKIDESRRPKSEREEETPTPGPDGPAPEAPPAPGTQAPAPVQPEPDTAPQGEGGGNAPAPETQQPAPEAEQPPPQPEAPPPEAPPAEPEGGAAPE